MLLYRTFVDVYVCMCVILGCIFCRPCWLALVLMNNWLAILGIAQNSGWYGYGNKLSLVEDKEYQGPLVTYFHYKERDVMYCIHEDIRRT